MYYLAGVLVGLFTLLYFYMTRNFGKFSACGVAEHSPVFPFGSPENRKLLTGKMSHISVVESIYEQHRDERLVVHFMMDKPHVVVRDLELAKMVMIKDFDHFVDRRHVDLHEDVGSNVYAANMLTMLRHCRKP